MAAGSAGEKPARARGTVRRTRGRARGARGRGGRGWKGGVFFLLVALAAAAVAVRFGCVDRRAIEKVPLRGLTAPAGQEATLYFADPRWTRLVPEVRRLPGGLDAVQLLDALVEALAQGPRQEGAAPVLPRGTRLRGAYLGAEGLAVVDIEPPLGEFSPGGASGELLTVFALVHTLSENVPGIRSVQILVGGEERQTLAGHVKISEPLTPDPQWTADPK